MPKRFFKAADKAFDLSKENLQRYADLKQHLELYHQYYTQHHDIQPLFSELETEEQREAFKKSLFEHGYDQWLSLNHETVYGESGDRICQLVSEFQRHQNFLIFLVEVESKIVDAHRDPEEYTRVTLDKAIRSKNTTYITALTQQNDAEMEIIQTYQTSGIAEHMPFS